MEETTAQSRTSTPSLEDLVGRFGDRLPILDPELSKRLNLPDAATLDEIQGAFDDRLVLYRKRTESDLPRPVRMKNQALLRQLEALTADFDRFKVDREVWELLGEAAILLESGIFPKCRLRLTQADRLKGPETPKPLERWYEDMTVDLDSLAPGQQEQPKSAIGDRRGSQADQSALPTPTLTAPSSASARESVADKAATFPDPIPFAPTSQKTPRPTPSPPVETPSGRAYESRVSDGPHHLTLELPDGRRLHIISGSVMRLGRSGQRGSVRGSVPLLCICRQSKALTVTLNTLISRKHCEFRVSHSSAYVFDGWSESGAYSLRPSKTGVFVDGKRVGISGLPLSASQIVKATSRSPGPDTPHWETRLLHDSGSASRIPGWLGQPPAGIQGLFLKRLDDIPEDILLVRGTMDLSTLGLATGSFWLSCRDGCLEAGSTQLIQLERIQEFIPGTRLLSQNSFASFNLKELLN